jgi:hypothetical protein
VTIRGAILSWRWIHRKSSLLETDWPEFEGMSHGGYSVEWSGDSSVALVTLDGKWGPRDFILRNARG